MTGEIFSKTRRRLDTMFGKIRKIQIISHCRQNRFCSILISRGLPSAKSSESFDKAAAAAANQPR